MRIGSVILLTFFVTATFAQEDSLDRKKVGFAVYPAFSYTPETSAMIGAVAFFVFRNEIDTAAENYRPTSISPYVVYSLRNQLEANVDFDIFFKNGNNLNLTARYFDFPDFYYGIGNQTLEENEEGFTARTLYLEGQLMKPLTQKHFLGFIFDVRYDDLYDFDMDGVLRSTEISGSEGGFLWGLGPAFRLDSRDNVLFPSRGNYIDFNVLFYPDLFGNDFNYSLFTLDFRKYLSIKTDKNILAFQLITRYSPSEGVPFYKLPKLGGSRRLRGINHYNRYIDNTVFYAQAEYRRHLFWRFGAVLFAGFGDVANHYGDYQLDEMKAVVGIGGRFQALKDEKLNARIDIGFALNGQSGLYFLIREAF